MPNSGIVAPKSAKLWLLQSKNNTSKCYHSTFVFHSDRSRGVTENMYANNTLLEQSKYSNRTVITQSAMHYKNMPFTSKLALYC